MPSPPPLPPSSPADPPTPVIPAAKNLSAKQVPWGAAKPTANKPAPAVTPLPLSAKKIPWGAARKATAVAPASAAKNLSARQVPWAASKTPSGKSPSPPPSPPPSKFPEPSTWALPKIAGLKAGDSPRSEPPPEQTRESLRREAQPDGEPTAAQLVAFLGKKTARAGAGSEVGSRASSGGGRKTRVVREPTDRYKARPISFVPTRWEIVKMHVSAHRLRWSLAGAGLCAVLLATYLMRLTSLDAEIDRRWQGLEGLLRQRYALAPEYVKCIQAYSEDERFTFALAEKGLAEWRAAHTEKEMVLAAARMERVMKVLAKVMNRYDLETVAKESAEEGSSLQFARLEEQREQSRVLLSDAIRSYNQAVGDFNHHVIGPPGAWVAWMAKLHARAPFSSDARE